MDKMYKKMHNNAVKSAASAPGLELYKLYWWHDDSVQWPVFPMTVEETRRNQERTPFKMQHRGLVLALLLEGRHVYSFKSSNTIEVCSGELCIIPPDCAYSFESEAGYHKLVIIFSGTLIKEICSTMGLGEPGKCKLPSGIKLEKMMRETAAMLKNENINNTPQLLAETNKILTEISILFSSCTMTSDHLLFTKIKAALARNLSRNINLEDVASEFSISLSSLHKLFGRYSQLTPGQYRIDRKMTRARFCLTYTDKSIKEISFQLGYSNQHYFSNDFKKHNNMTPSEFRYTSRSR